MLETAILLHTAYCLKINERNYTKLHSMLIFLNILNITEVCREILRVLEGCLIQGVVWHSCTAAQPLGIARIVHLRLEFQELPEE